MAYYTVIKSEMLMLTLTFKECFVPHKSFSNGKLMRIKAQIPCLPSLT